VIYRGHMTAIDHASASARLEYLFWLDGEAKSYCSRSVEHLKEMVTGQAAELTLGPLLGNQFDPAVASVALRTGDVGFSHRRNMRCQLWRKMRCQLLFFQCPPKPGGIRRGRAQGTRFARLVADVSDSRSLRKSCFAESLGERGEVLRSAKWC
jgi:hypothetical protein